MLALLQTGLEGLKELTPLLNSGISTVLLLILIFRTIPSVLKQRTEEIQELRAWAKEQVEELRDQYVDFINRMESQKNVEFKMLIEAEKAKTDAFLHKLEDLISHSTAQSSAVLTEVKSLIDRNLKGGTQ